MTNPACENCHREAQEPYAICGVCLDIEFCCNVSKDLWGTKSLARWVAIQEGMSEALSELDARAA